MKSPTTAHLAFKNIFCYNNKKGENSMKKFLLFVIVLINTLVAGEIQKFSIVDIYSMVQKEGVTNLNFPLYHQTLKEDKWVSITTDWGTYIDATVDEKNGYIYILDEGTGGGSSITQAALWQDKVGDILLIVAEHSYDGTLERSFLKAFAYTPMSGAAISLVAPPIPKLSLLDFASEAISTKDLRTLQKMQPTIHYRLPRKGTSIHALLMISDTFQKQSAQKECYYEKKVCVEMKRLYRYYEENLKGKIYRDIELGWSGYEFAIKRKSRQEPTEILYHPKSIQ